MRALLLGVAWAATVAAAWFLGSTQAGSGGDGDAGSVPRRESSGAAETAREDAGPRLAGTENAGTLRAGSGDAAPQGEDGAGSPTETDEAILSLEFTLEGVTTADEASDRIMRHVAALLAKGKEGHLEILQFLNDHIVNNEEMKRLFGSDQEAARLIYPWIRFLVHREDQVLDLTEAVYETMAKNPQALEGLDEDALEVFTEGVAMILPGAVDEERLERFRGYARAVLDAPEGSLPEPIRDRRREIERARAYWAPRLAAPEALERLQRGDLTPQEAMSLLRRIPPEQRADLDVAVLLGPALRDGEYRVINGLLSLRLDARDIALLDQAVLEGAEAGKYRSWNLRQYLRATERGAWPQPQSFIELGLSRVGNAADVFAEVLGEISPRPPADYVRWVLATFQLSDRVRTRLQAGFGLK